MKITEGYLVLFKAWCYYIVAQLSPIAGLLATAADANTNDWPSSLKIWSSLVTGFVAGVIAVRAFFDSSHSNYMKGTSNDTTIKPNGGL
jgi:hypothetical protein